VREAAAAPRAAGAVAAALDRLPALVTTGVGSLPFTEPREAAAHAAGAYGLPFCPQLPRLEGDMVVEWLGGDPGRCGWSPDRDRERPAAWGVFTEAMAESPPEHRLAKLQVTGPATLATALEGPGQTHLAAEIATWLAANAAGQVRRLAELGLGAVLVVDEPGLDGAGIADPMVWDPLRTAGAAAWGVHVCGPVPWPLVDVLEPDLVSFDLVRHRPDAAGRSVLARLVERGGRVVWGAVDPVSPDTAAPTATLVGDALRSLGLPVALVARRSLVSPACGTGLLEPSRERRIARTVAVAATALRAPRFMR
jgi:hypothetical protein